MSKDVLLLGATGSIGTQTIDLCTQEKDFHIVGVTLASHIEVLKNLLSQLPYLQYVGIKDEKKAREFHASYPQYQIYSGEDINTRMVQEVPYDKVVNALVGENGFLPSLLALRRNKDLCLANKESLVIGGFLLNRELDQGHGRLFAIDSEHVALAKLLEKVRREEVERMIITASGGSLRDYPREKLKDVTVEDVLHHPTWKMGKRITVDSCTMVNKGFEFIEASYLYRWDIHNISPLINDESEVHSALLMKDNSYFFEVGPSDMRVPISYALNEGRRVKANYKSVDFDKKCSLNFRKFEKERYPLFSLVLKTYEKGGTAMAFFNAVDEECIKAFVEKKISYLTLISSITDLVENRIILVPDPDENDILETDKKAREITKDYLLSLEK